MGCQCINKNINSYVPFMKQMENLGSRASYIVFPYSEF